MLLSFCRMPGTWGSHLSSPPCTDHLAIECVSEGLQIERNAIIIVRHAGPRSNVCGPP
jgi:hypothetical protein